ncbi:hypothetical protein OE88DRAFT_1732155 [Heliocybe sulcata]|uniref:Uncharacterized protein n=1 Tax=Heliocybe sulcata TaxID=5364 RepID=A0A5C3NAM2_9AGAM|nr:hypothetical protein OE88DRAFT_1732155 [Heliocybe sulcata]
MGGERRHVLCIEEWKKAGATIGDPEVQIVAGYCKLVSGKAADYAQQIYFPAVLLTYTGRLLRIYGAVYIDRGLFKLRTLSPLDTALYGLEAYYQGLMDEECAVESCLFLSPPSPKTSTPLNQQLFGPESSRTTWVTTVFDEQYDYSANKALADDGPAPKVHCASPFVKVCRWSSCQWTISGNLEGPFLGIQET